MKKILTIKTNKGEISIEDFSTMERKRIILLMKKVEDEFGINLRDYKELRNEFLNVANFIRDIPNMVCEVYSGECKNELDDK